MSSTIKPTTGTGTGIAGTTGAVEDEHQVVTGATPSTVLAVTRIVMGVAFVLGFRRQSV